MPSIGEVIARGHLARELFDGCLRSIGGRARGLQFRCCTPALLPRPLALAFATAWLSDACAEFTPQRRRRRWCAADRRSAA